MPDHPASSPGSPDFDDQRLADRLRDALVMNAFHVIAIVSEVASASELSLTQLRLLAILTDRAPTMSQLARFLGLDRSSVTGLIDRAAERGLVRRCADAGDQRVTRIALTDAGRQLALSGAVAIRARLDPAFAELDQRDRRVAAVLLERILGGASAASVDGFGTVPIALDGAAGGDELSLVSDVELRRQIAQLAHSERLVSDVRRSLHGELDRSRAELVDRLRRLDPDSR